MKAFPLNVNFSRCCYILHVILTFFMGICFVAGDTNTVYAILGHSAVLKCNGYDAVRAADNLTGNITDIFALRWFKNRRASDYIVFTFLYMFNHATQMPQNEWTERNVTFSVTDQPQIRLPNVTFSDEANYICDLTPAAEIAPVLTETRLKVVACPETMDLDIFGSTFPPLPSTKKSWNNNNKNLTSITLPLHSDSTTGVRAFTRGTQFMVRCSTVSFPEAAMRISIPGLQLNKPDWQNMTQRAVDNGYTETTLDAWFTLDAPDNLLRSKSLTIDCRASVGNETCVTVNSLGLQVLVPTTWKQDNGMQLTTAPPVTPTSTSPRFGLGMNTTEMTTTTMVPTGSTSTKRYNNGGPEPVFATETAFCIKPEPIRIVCSGKERWTTTDLDIQRTDATKLTIFIDNSLHCRNDFYAVHVKMLQMAEKGFLIQSVLGTVTTVCREGNLTVDVWDADTASVTILTLESDMTSRCRAQFLDLLKFIYTQQFFQPSNSSKSSSLALKPVKSWSEVSPVCSESSPLHLNCNRTAVTFSEKDVLMTRATTFFFRSDDSFRCRVIAKSLHERLLSQNGTALPLQRGSKISTVNSPDAVVSVCHRGRMVLSDGNPALSVFKDLEYYSAPNKLCRDMFQGFLKYAVDMLKKPSAKPKPSKASTKG